jgi:hypothetical protein
LSYHDTLCLTINADPSLDLDAVAGGARYAVERLLSVPAAGATAPV